MKTGTAFTLTVAAVKKKLFLLSNLAKNVYEVLGLQFFIDSPKGWYGSIRKLTRAYMACTTKSLRRTQVRKALEELEAAGLIAVVYYRGGLIARVASSIEEANRWQSWWKKNGRAERNKNEPWIRHTAAAVAKRRAEYYPVTTVRQIEASTIEQIVGSKSPAPSSDKPKQAPVSPVPESGRDLRPHVAAPSVHPKCRDIIETPTRVNVGVSLSSSGTTGARASKDRAPVSDNSGVVRDEKPKARTDAPVADASGVEIPPAAIGAVMGNVLDEIAIRAEKRKENGSSNSGEAPTENKASTGDDDFAASENRKVELLMVARGIYGSSVVGDYPVYVREALRSPMLSEATARFVRDRMKPNTRLQVEIARAKYKPSVTPPKHDAPRPTTAPDVPLEPTVLQPGRPEVAANASDRHMERGIAMLRGAGLLSPEMAAKLKAMTPRKKE